MKNRKLRKNFLLLLCALIATPLLQAQSKAPSEPAQAPSATFSARTELVLVPAIVTDHQGRHVTGLTKDDFIVQENGVEQKVETFEEVTATANHIARVSGMAQHEFSNTHFSDYAPRRINIIVLDTINTKIFDQQRAKQDLVKFLASSVTDQDLTSLLVMTRGGVHVIHDFTRDPQVLVRALHRVKGQVDVMAGENTDAMSQDSSDPTAAAEASALLSMIDEAEKNMAQQMQESAIDATLDGFEDIASAFAGVPGRKAVIWITGGFPLRLEQPGDIVASRFQIRYQDFFEKLNHANMALYPVDARGLVVTGISAADSMRTASGRQMNPTNVLRGRSVQNQQTIDTLTFVADSTGGRAFYNTNDLSHAISRAADDSSSYYLLGYYVKSDQSKPGWRKLSVKVRRGGVSVRARSGYLATRDHETDPDALRRRDVSEALRSPLEFTAMSLTVRLVGQQPAQPDKSADPAKPTPSNKKDVVFDVIVPPNSIQIDEADQNHVNLQVVAVARDAAARQADASAQTIEAHLKPESLQKIRTGGFSYRSHVTVPPGEYSVKVVVRDNISGRVGSVLAPFTVE